MSRNNTQFAIAIISVSFVGAIVGFLVWGAIFRGVEMATAMAAFSGLTGVSAAATAWLFRVNNVNHK